MSAAQLTQQICCSLLTPAASVEVGKTIGTINLFLYGFLMPRACKKRPPERKNRRFLAGLLYHNLITIHTTATKSSSLLQNLMGYLTHVTEMG